MTETLDLDKAREAAHRLVDMNTFERRQDVSWIDLLAALILEQCAKEAERWRDLAFGRGEILQCDHLMSLGRKAKQRAEDLRQQAKEAK